MIGNDTIFALSSGQGRAGVAVMRLSGQRAIETVEKLSKQTIKPRNVVYSAIVNPADGQKIDSGIVFTFKAPASFTGEDMAEIQVHGSHAVTQTLSEVLMAEGIRPAEAGEFTMRAFRNGKMDLAQAEALADLIDAETNKQRQQALGQMGGALSSEATDWRDRLISILAPLEAGIDFPDEGDVPEMIEKTARPVIEALLQVLEQYLTEAQQADRVRNGVRVALIGPPNAGKSSLLNYLSNSEAAIVSDIPGTTRDVIEVRLDLGGVPVVLIDTAGMRAETRDVIEAEGIKRARDKAQSADIRVALVDGKADPGEAIPVLDHLKDDDFFLLNKKDLGAPGMFHVKQSPYISSISLKTGEGMQEFLSALEERVTLFCGDVDQPRLTRERHVFAVREAVSALQRSLDILAIQPELSAEDVRLAARHLGTITGNVDVEDVLGEIFSSFCIGK
jgi:tRNA modification GTPase